jgi:DNA-binding response OmpR family regulator/HPt (histidine-containing phosphotransfer) domain-containing protein
MRILLVEDDAPLAALLRHKLVEQQYVVDIAADGQEGWEMAEAIAYDLIVLDVMLPKLDGVSFCRKLRSQGIQALVLLLTARAAEDDKILGLDAGADDYLVKPISLPELTARIRALLRRRLATVTSTLAWGALQLNLDTHEVTYAEKPLMLTAKEYALVELFLRNNQHIFSQRSIISQLWSLEADPPGEETVRAHVKRLRQKLKAFGAEDLIETVYGLGYRLNQAFQHQKEPDSESFDRADISQLNLKQQLLDRISIIEKGMQIIQENKLDPKVNDQARYECHRLTGLLGMIGLPQGSELARSIESLLESEPLSAAQKKVLAALVHQLYDLIRSANLDNIDLRPPSPAIDPNATKINATKIMVLDDDRLVLRLLRVMLEPWGMQIVTLDHSQSFWQELEIAKPDLLILDVHLPEIDGVELCHALRNHSQWAWLPILFLTGQQDAETVQRIFAAGADDYASKPIVAPELVTRILNRLERVRVLRQQPQLC